MKLKTISSDFDNVLFNLEQLNIIHAKMFYGVDLTPADITYWNFYGENYPKIVNTWGDFSFYQKGEFINGDIDFINTLKDMGFEVQIVTASFPSIAAEKDEMIYDRYGDIRIIHEKNKSIVTKDSILIDDGPHNIRDHILTNNQPAVIVDNGFGWTEHFDSHLVRRAASFSDIIESVHKLNK